MKKSLCIIALFTNLSIIIHAQKEIITDAPTIFSSSNIYDSKQLNQNIQTITDLVQDVKEEKKSQNPMEFFIQTTPDLPTIIPSEEEEEFHDAVESFTQAPPDLPTITPSSTTVTPEVTPIISKTEAPKKSDITLASEDFTGYVWEHPSLQYLEFDTSGIQQSLQNDHYKNLFSTLFPKGTQKKFDAIIYALKHLKEKCSRFQVEILKASSRDFTPAVAAVVYTILYYDLRTLEDYKNYLFSQMGPTPHWCLL